MFLRSIMDLCGRYVKEVNLWVYMHVSVSFLFFILDAAEVLRSNRRLFEQNVNKAMRGGYVNGVYFERCLGR